MHGQVGKLHHKVVWLFVSVFTSCTALLRPGEWVIDLVEFGNSLLLQTHFLDHGFADALPYAIVNMLLQGWTPSNLSSRRWPTTRQTVCSCCLPYRMLVL